ncbi:MAG TPA: HWE histidine kinase domain-containing protein [Caulobacteraceae bacterium]
MRAARGAPRTLRLQLVLFATSLLVPAFIAMAALLVVNLGESREAREQELIATARAVGAAVDRDLSRAMAINDTLVGSEAFARGDWEAARRRAERIPLGADAWLVLSTDDGVQRFNTNPDARPQTAPVLPRPANMQRARQTGRGSVSDLITGAYTGRRLVSIDTHVETGGRGMNLAHLIAPTRFLSIFALQPLPEGAAVTLIGRDHRLIARSVQHEQMLGRRASPDMIAAMQASPEGVHASRSLAGEKTMVGFSRSPVSGWTVLVFVPRAQFDRPLYRNLLGFGLLALITGLIGSLVARSYSRTISRELELLEQDAVNLGHGAEIPLRRGLIVNFEQLQRAISEASRELATRAGQQRLMINELNHRVKNTLATVQSLAVQTFRGGDPEAPAKFDTRLAALASAHDLLTATSWEEVAIGEVVTRCGPPLPDRVDAGGDDVMLQPQAALALCMCLHELATNSLKYGALSSAIGRVTVRWTLVEPDALELVWTERDGPLVEGPTRRGFGTRLIDRLIENELAGRVERDYRPEGLVIRARLQLGVSSRWTNRFEAPR